MTMSEQQRQHLSALVDEEIDSALVHATVSALESDERLSDAWEHYHLIGAGIRSEPLRGEYRQIASLVRARIAEEPVPITPARPHRRRTSRLGPFAGAALAASAAFFAVFAVPRLFEPQPGAPTPAVVRALPPPPEPFRLNGPAQRWHVDEPALQTKLDRLLVTHQEQSRASGVKGFLPYATVVGYEAGR
jgi:sigma-E factor negative regulatory protein RseA